MDRVRVHAHVSNPDTHTIPQFDYQWFCTRENSAVECKEVEIGHDVWIWCGCTWFDKPFSKEDAEITVNPWLFWPSLIWGWFNPPTPSIPLGRSTPCQWIVVCSASLLVTNMRTRSPSTASM